MAWEKGDICLLFNFRNWKTSPPCVSSPTVQTSLCHSQAPSISHLPALFHRLSFLPSPITVRLFEPQDALTPLISSIFTSLCYFLFSGLLFLHHSLLDKTGKMQQQRKGTAPSGQSWADGSLLRFCSRTPRTSSENPRQGLWPPTGRRILKLSLAYPATNFSEDKIINCL